MSKKLYNVIAVQDRYIHGVGVTFKADDGYITHQSHQIASSPDEAIELVTSFYMPTGTKYDSIRAEYIRDA